MQKKPGEEFCKSKFDEFIKTVSKSASIRWEDVAPNEEPPDYYLYLNDTKYAVEVTSIVEKKEIGNLRLSSFAITSSLWRLVDEVEALAKKNHFLNGKYIVYYSQPITNFREIRKQLFDDLLAYVKKTQFRSSAPEQVVFKQGRQECTIKKQHDKKNCIGKTGPHDAKWQGEINEEIFTLLEERINDKHQKLGKISDPRILLLYDAYGFADSKMYRACLGRLNHLDFFHTIFVVRGDGFGWVLYSENPNWLS